MAAKGVVVHAAEGSEGFFRGIHRQRAATEIADAAAVIHSHDVVGMGMRNEDGIQIAKFFTEHLGPEIRSGVDDQSNRRGLDVNRGAQSMIPRVG